MEKSVHKWRKLFHPDIKKIRNSYEQPAGRIMDFSGLRQLPPLHPFPCGIYPNETSLQAIKICKGRGSPSEGSEITGVVSSIADIFERVFSSLASTQQGVTESVTLMRQRVKTLYSDIKEICGQLGVINPVEITLVERIIDMEYIVHTKISQRFQDIQSVISSCKDFFKSLVEESVFQQDKLWK